jgi:hypothetical protein
MFQSTPADRVSPETTRAHDVRGGRLADILRACRKDDQVDLIHREVGPLDGLQGGLDRKVRTLFVNGAVSPGANAREPLDQAVGDLHTGRMTDPLVNVRGRYHLLGQRAPDTGDGCSN